MPGYAAALTTLTTVKTELGISSSTDDDYLTYLIKAASDRIAGRCNRNFTYAANWAESVPAYGQTRIIVTHTPVIAITAISYDGGAELDAANYSIADPGMGWIYSRSGWTSAAAVFSSVRGNDLYVGSEYEVYWVVYAGGYVTPQQAIDDVLLTRSLPYDLEHACVQAVVTLFRGRGQDRRISNESLLSYSVAYRDIDEVPEVSCAVRRYRRIGTGR